MKKFVIEMLAVAAYGVFAGVAPAVPKAEAKAGVRAGKSVERQVSDRMAKLLASSAVRDTVAREFTADDGSKFLYRWHEPRNRKPGEKYPLVVLLHGAGERGDDNVSQLIWGAVPLFEYMEKRGKEFFFIAGQVPKGRRWVEVSWSAPEHRMPAEPSVSMKNLIELIGEVLAEEPSVDHDRVYATGISMGGYGTWDLVCRRTGWFAAAMPVCGGADVKQAAALRYLPVFIHHGDRDRAVPVWRGRSMIAALREAGSDVARYTEYPGYGHGSWIPAYGDEKNFDWLFSKKRVKLPEWAPVTLKEGGIAAPAGTFEIVFSFSADGGASWKRGMVRRLAGFPLTLVDDKVVTSPGFVFREPERGKWTLAAPEACKVSFRDVKCRALPEK